MKQKGVGWREAGPGNQLAPPPPGQEESPRPRQVTGWNPAASGAKWRGGH